VYSIPSLIAEWRAWQQRRAGETDFLFMVLLSVMGFVPADLAQPVSLWKVVVLVGLWAVAYAWARRNRESLRDEEGAPRLLWLWLPCAATGIGVMRTPVLGQAIAATMLVVAAGVTVTAWRRAPAKTSLAATIALGAPAAAVVLVGAALLVSGAAGQSAGHHWSAADYPAWYWQGVPGRVRGVNNRDAAGLGAGLIGLGAAALGAIVGMWALLARRWRRGERADGAHGGASAKILFGAQKTA
jgi:hypothetical protein